MRYINKILWIKNITILLIHYTTSIKVFSNLLIFPRKSDLESILRSLYNRSSININLESKRDTIKRKKRSISKELIEGQLIRHVLVGLNRFDGGRLQCNNELLSIHQPFHRVPTQGYISAHVKTDALNFRTISLILIVDLICDNLSNRNEFHELKISLFLRIESLQWLITIEMNCWN